MKLRTFINEKKGTIATVLNAKGFKSFTGIAKCNFQQGDNFDENFGEILSTLRVYKKYQAAKKRNYLKKQNSLYAQAKSFDKIIESVENEIQAIDDRIAHMLEKI